jgi:hypothetical protein
MSAPLNPRAVTERLNALPLEIRRGLLGGMEIGSAVFMALPGDELMYEIHRESKDLFEITPLTQEEVVDLILSARGGAS